MFVKLDGTHHSKVKIRNGDYIDVKGIGDIAIDSDSRVKIISDVLYVPEIDLNLLSVGQLLEKDFEKKEEQNDHGDGEVHVV